eukprot:4176909-Alexandrium_andersonii.AAC.1
MQRRNDASRNRWRRPPSCSSRAYSNVLLAVSGVVSAPSPRVDLASRLAAVYGSIPAEQLFSTRTSCICERWELVTRVALFSKEACLQESLLLHRSRIVEPKREQNRGHAYDSRAFRA